MHVPRVLVGGSGDGFGTSWRHKSRSGHVNNSGIDPRQIQHSLENAQCVLVIDLYIHTMTKCQYNNRNTNMAVAAGRHISQQSPLRRPLYTDTTLIYSCTDTLM